MSLKTEMFGTTRWRQGWVFSFVCLETVVHRPSSPLRTEDVCQSWVSFSFLPPRPRLSKEYRVWVVNLLPWKGKNPSSLTMWFLWGRVPFLYNPSLLIHCTRSSIVIHHNYDLRLRPDLLRFRWRVTPEILYRLVVEETCRDKERLWWEWCGQYRETISTRTVPSDRMVLLWHWNSRTIEVRTLSRTVHHS